MHVISALNVNHALAEGLRYLNEHGTHEDSRNGPVLVSPCPVTTMYAMPEQRVIFSPLRDANPFFHLMEALWMMAGRDDLSWPLHFNKRFADYSDDGQTIHGAYGYRWRRHFGMDQIYKVVQELRGNMNSRRAVIAMWDPEIDLGMNSNDLPCNTTIFFRVRGRFLDMTVCNRSNDIYWGAYGANAVHMSILQEFVARAIGIHMGYYYQVSNNYHLYTGIPELESQATREVMAYHATKNDHYAAHFIETVHPFPLMRVSDTLWMSELNDFMQDPNKREGHTEPFFTDVAVPMFNAWHERKNKISDGEHWVSQIAAEDWRLACTEWIERRRN